MSKWNYNLQSFYNEDNISYYILGAWITDGCIYKYKNRPNKKTVTLTSKDKDWLELINNYICPEKPLLEHGKNCYRLMYNSTKLADWFISKGCDERKSLTVQFPSIPKQYMNDFIRGCWDGDGSLSFTKRNKSYQCQANLTCGSYTFCQKLSEILNENNIKCSIYEHGKNQRKIEGRLIQSNPCWRVVLSGGGSVYNLVKQLYLPNTILKMPRKSLLAQNIIKFREANFSVSLT